MLKTEEPCLVLFDKDYIDIQTERLPGSSPNLCVTAHCFGCPHNCMIRFTSPNEFRFAFVAKLASVFSSLCKKLVKEQELKERLAGLPFLTLGANDNKEGE